MWTLLLTTAAAEPSAPSAAIEPVLEWAERDRRRTGWSRAGLVVSIAGPGLLGVGGLALDSYSTTGVEGAAGVALTTAGTVGVLVGPPMLLLGAGSAAGALRRQGLSVSRAPSNLGLVTYAVGVGASPSLGIGGGAAFGFVAAAYTGGVALGVLQQTANYRARRGAGWLDASLVPQLGDAPGLQLAGTF